MRLALEHIYILNQSKIIKNLGVDIIKKTMYNILYRKIIINNIIKPLFFILFFIFYSLIVLWDLNGTRRNRDNSRKLYR